MKGKIVPFVVGGAKTPEIGVNYSKSATLVEGKKGLGVTVRYSAHQNFRLMGFAYRDTTRSLPAGGILTVFVGSSPRNITIDSAYHKSVQTSGYWSTLRAVKSMLREYRVEREYRKLIVANVKKFLVTNEPTEIEGEK